LERAWPKRELMRLAMPKSATLASCMKNGNAGWVQAVSGFKLDLFM
jgi:hypothetical protein